MPAAYGRELDRLIPVRHRYTGVIQDQSVNMRRSMAGSAQRQRHSPAGSGRRRHGGRDLAICGRYGSSKKVRRSERLASLGRLASGVAHEIRNPLSAIKGFAQYFRDKFQTGSEDRSYADIMIQEAERLNRVIDGLLDFARPRELDARPHPLSQILERPLQLIRTDLDRKGISLTTSIPEVLVRADPDQMTQAFLNIFLNSIDAMEEGGELRVAATMRPEEGRAEIRIADNGTGISPEDLPRIFDPFFSTKKKGTGLGLAITAKIIEAHQGDISVESRRGKGTTFKIYLPSRPLRQRARREEK